MRRDVRHAGTHGILVCGGRQDLVGKDDKNLHTITKCSPSCVLNMSNVTKTMMTAVHVGEDTARVQILKQGKNKKKLF